MTPGSITVRVTSSSSNSSRCFKRIDRKHTHRYSIFRETDVRLLPGLVNIESICIL